MAAITKPTIANQEFEYDASTLEGFSNNDSISTWADQSGNSNDLTSTGVDRPSYLTNGWKTGVPAVRFRDTGFGPNNDELMNFNGGVFVGTDVTFFVVVQVVDISEGCALIGSFVSGTPPRYLYTFVHSNGALYFSYGDEGATDTTLISATGLVSAGDKIVVTFRHTDTNASVSPKGRLIRLNGVQVATDPTDFQYTLLYDTQATIGYTRTATVPSVGTIVGVDKKFVYIAGYSKAASDADIEQMECYLGGLYGVAVEGCPPPDVVRATVILDTSVTVDLELNQTISTRVQLEGTITEDVDA